MVGTLRVMPVAVPAPPLTTMLGMKISFITARPACAFLTSSCAVLTRGLLSSVWFMAATNETCPRAGIAAVAVTKRRTAREQSGLNFIGASR